MDTGLDSARTASSVVQRCLGSLQERIGSQKYNAWFRQGTKLTIEENAVRVTAPNPFVANWIETHFQADIVSAVEAHTNRQLPMVMTVDPSLSGQLKKTQRDSQADLVHKAAEGRSRTAPSTPAMRHRLEDFVVGQSNRLAFGAAQAVALVGKAQFNPLFIHGPCGVGKTHLVQGICSAVNKLRRPSGGPMTWRYVTGEQFTNEFVTALRQKKIAEFRANYRKLDLLAIDDVHFLASKRATQDEFLHTFNALESAGNQIIMASDAHPRLVGEFNEQLVSRFVAGMVVKIDTPDLSTRIEILLRKSSTLKTQIPRDVLEYLAANVRGSVRELEGTLVKLVAVASLEGKEMSVALANEALADLLARTDSAITLGDIETAVAAFFGITPADIHSSRRTKTVSAARMITMYLARRHTRMSYPEIGKFLGKNHSSVVLGVQRLESLISSEGEVEWMTPMGLKSMPAAKLLQLLTEQFA